MYWKQKSLIMHAETFPGLFLVSYGMLNLGLNCKCGKLGCLLRFVKASYLDANDADNWQKTPPGKITRHLEGISYLAKFTT